MDTKICLGCFYQLPLSAFHKDSRRKDGHRARCKKCRSDNDYVLDSYSSQDDMTVLGSSDQDLELSNNLINHYWKKVNTKANHVFPKPSSWSFTKNSDELPPVDKLPAAYLKEAHDYWVELVGTGDVTTRIA